MWSGSENDVTPAESAHGYKSLAMHAPGDDFPVYDDMRKHVIDKGLVQEMDQMLVQFYIVAVCMQLFLLLKEQNLLKKYMV